MEELFISRVRVKLLTLFLTSQEPLLHVREIVRRVDEEINAVRRELLRMEKFGMVAKQSGLGGEIIKNRVRLGKIKYAMIATRFFKRQPSGPEDVDLLVVGQIVLPELQSLISNEQAKRDQEINYSFMDEAEFQFRVRRRDPFILRVVTQSKIMLIGDEEDLLLGVLI